MTQKNYIQPDFNIETTIVFTENYLIDYNHGNKYSVTINFMNIWNSWKIHKFNTLHIFHVHPPNCLFLSDIDLVCARGLLKAFPSNINILFSVYSGNKSMVWLIKKDKYYKLGKLKIDNTVEGRILDRCITLSKLKQTLNKVIIENSLEFNINNYSTIYNFNNILGFKCKFILKMIKQIL